MQMREARDVIRIYLTQSGRLFAYIFFLVGRLPGTIIMTRVKEKK